jgi:hypothetical protein
MFDLPGKPAKSCRSPFRDDDSPSFSVYDDGNRWHDFATGESGDAIDFLGKIKGLNKAYLAFLELADEGISRYQHKVNPGEKAAVSPLAGIRLSPCTEAGLAQLSTVRQIPIEGPQLAAQRKLLWHYHYPIENCQCWLVTDSYRRNAIIRRLDGKAFNGNKKSLCLKGSQANWPIGIAQATNFPAIALCEGAPDFLAAFYLAWAGGTERFVAPVCITGASCAIHHEALALFRGKRVRIFGHADEPGKRAVVRWAEQLRKVQAEVDAFYFEGLRTADGSPVNDLNDFVLADDNRSECGIEVITGAVDFGLERSQK